MYILKDFQEKAVSGLLSYTYEALTHAQQQTPILLEAPTGSGKTVMMASYLERLVDELPLRPGLSDNVAYIWFAPNTLHVQSFLSLQKLYNDNSKISCLDLSYLNANPVLNPKDLLFVNWSSVDGMTKIWRKDNESNTNLETLIENTRANSTKIILIIDEAHLSAFTGRQAVAVRSLIRADVEISVTATPTHRPQRSVFISRQEVVQEEMIKKGVRLNIGLDPEQQNGENLHIHLLRKAFAKKMELQRMYDAELGPNVVNPLLLIQLPSDNASLSEDDKSIRDTLVGLLNTEFNISTNNGRLGIWLSGEKDKDGLEDINGFQDVLIFKQAIAQGWDCPRAAVLVSYRSVGNVNFGVQTVGRILRMPHQKHYVHDDLNYGYVYTNIESTRISLVPSDTDYFNLQLAQRQEDKGWAYCKIPTAAIVNDRPSAGVLTSVYARKFFDVMEERYSVRELPEIDLFNQDEVKVYEELQTFNKQAMIQNGWEFTIDTHQIHIPTDIELDPYEVTAIMIGYDKMQDFAITMEQFGTMFDRFCYDNITRLNRSKSWKKLRETLLTFCEYYLGMHEYEARKFFLFPQNKALLIPHITQALERFEQWQKEKGNDNRRVVHADWEVPEIRYYNELYKKENIDKHALEPFFEYQKASGPEVEFKNYLNQHEHEIEWWYKNGNQGHEHFAVSYVNMHNELKLFYVDFVIKFKTGKVGLFDTKTMRSDHEAPNKHNALIAYMETENEVHPDTKLIGGVLIPEDTNGVILWRYCLNRIADTNDLTGWDYFDPAKINKS
jgi:type III restriction enzyme